MTYRPSIITTKELSARLGRSQSALWQMIQRNALLRSCVIDETRTRMSWSVARLIKAGFLLDDQPSAIPVPSLSLTERTADVG